MAEHSPIGWTDATWPIVAGCSYASPGCSNCWAVRDSWRLSHNPHAAVQEAFKGTVRKTAEGALVWTGEVRPLPQRLDWPLTWRKAKRIFVCSQSDLFHPKVPFEFIAATFGVMQACPQHEFQVLTKHPARMRDFFEWAAAQQNGAAETCAWEARRVIPGLCGYQYEEIAPWPLENVWLGVTVEDQQRADERIPLLLRCPAEKRWLSVEPMLEAVSVAFWLKRPYQVDNDVHPSIDWIVCGGESAQTRANTRPFEVNWARRLLEQCRAAGVPFFMKQLGTVPLFERGALMTTPFLPAGKTSRYKWHEPQHWPADLRVQEFPA